MSRRRRLSELGSRRRSLSQADAAVLEYGDADEDLTHALAASTPALHMTARPGPLQTLVARRALGLTHGWACDRRRPERRP